MKRLLPILMLSLLLWSCDPGFNQYCMIRNDADQPVDVIPAGYRIARNYELGTTDTIYNKPFTLAAGEDTMAVYDGGIGAADLDNAHMQMVYFFGDSVIFRFADGCQRIYHATDTLGNSPYNPLAPAYTWEEKVGKPWAGHTYFGQLTFTIDNSQHPAANHQ